MKKIAHLGLGILKLLGLIVLVMVINGIPMLFLAKGQNLPIYTEILLVLAYLVLVFFAIRTLWRRYQTHVSEDIKVLSFSWGDFGKALLFFLAARIVAVVGTYLNILLTGQSTTSNDNALQSLGKIMSVNHIFFFFFYVVTLVVIAPVIEELVFRGFATIFFFEKGQKIPAANHYNKNTNGILVPAICWCYLIRVFMLSNVILMSRCFIIHNCNRHLAWLQLHQEDNHFQLEKRNRG